ncbi:MAG: hypothetical protein IJV17_05330 [Prevotella sp.]|nr:hypothetical protein [Prevotella sp.]
MRRISFIYILSMMSTLSCLGVPADSIQVERHSIWHKISSESWRNPALHGKAYQHAHSQLRVGVDNSKQSEAFVLQKGAGKTYYDIEAETFLRLSKRTSVWGNASYMTGKNRDIFWNSVSDYDLLEPYILADTLGGDTERERYVFEGGYATQRGSFLLGGELLFRADHEYRTVDPRMRSVVTDLRLRGGAAYVTNTYHWGAAIEANIYKQTNNVTFYRETGVIPEYQMTGLGAVYVRFSGEVNNLYFNGGGVQLYLSAVPRSGNGFFADLCLGEHRYERIAASLNSLPLTKLYAEQMSGQFGWCHHGANDFALSAHVSYVRRLGDENMVGSSLSNNYPILTTLTMYKNHRLDTYLQAVYGRQRLSSWHVMLKGGFRQNKEEYVEPARKMGYSQMYGKLEGQYITGLTKQLTLTSGLHGGYYANTDSELNIPVVNTEAGVVDMLYTNYDFMKANYFEADAYIRGDYRIGSSRYGVFLQIGGGYTHCSVGSHETRVSLNAGMTF